MVNFITDLFHNLKHKKYDEYVQWMIKPAIKMIKTTLAAI